MKKCWQADPIREKHDTPGTIKQEKSHHLNLSTRAFLRAALTRFVITVLLLAGISPFSVSSAYLQQGLQSAIAPSGKHFSNVSFSGQYLEITSDTDNPLATCWNPDGTLFFITGRYSNNVAMYALTKPWEISSAVFVMAVEIPGKNQHGLYIRADGQKMWVFDRTSIWTFKLDNPWDLSTMSKGVNTDYSHFVIRGHDIDFKPDGTILFIDDRDAEAIFEVTLSTPWEVSSGILTYTLDINDQQEELRGIEFLNDGKVMMLLDTKRNEVLQYNLQTPWKISTATFFGTFDISNETQQGRGLSFSADENKMYVTGRDEKRVFQYELKTE
ncbi:MAG: hypothetical protein EA361_01545 [Bacteroidetes bacterium]|nr:MAG: hypothetical protein EA361_01545 [Bacteroidota bacterium]